MRFRILFALSFPALLLLCGESVIFTITNNCPYTIWPATETSSDLQPSTSDFELRSKASNIVNALALWSGRIWAKTFCTTDESFTCRTGDCGRGITCNGVDAVAPITLVEFTLNGNGGKDFYDVSLIYGFNLLVHVAPQEACESTSCLVDINKKCLANLVVRDQNGATIECKNACPFFKMKCPQAYCSPNDVSTFACPTGPNYAISFCP